MEHPGRQLLFDIILFDDLKRYIEDKKRALKQALFLALSTETIKLGPELELPEQKDSSLKGAAAAFSEQVDSLSTQKAKEINYENINQRLEEILFGLVEILEGMVRELYDQIKITPIDKYTDEFSENVLSTKDLIYELIIEVKEFSRTLGKALKKLSLKVLKSHPYTQLKQIRAYIHPAIDSDIKTHLDKAEILLFNEYKDFKKSYDFFLKFFKQIEGVIYKFEGFYAFQKLDDEKRKSFVRLLRLLKALDASRKESRKIEQKVIFSIKTVFPYPFVRTLFKEYLTQLKNLTFEFAKRYRGKKEVSAQAILCILRAEIHTLEPSIIKYRDFLLKTNPNPYARKTGMMAEWIVGPESKRTKELKKLSAECIQLDKYLEELFLAQEGEDERDETFILSQFTQLDLILHDMGQPLTSRSIMQKKGKEFLVKLDQIKEITAPMQETSMLVQDALIKAMRLDSKFLTLNELPEFYRLYALHIGLYGKSFDSSHLKRMKLYKKVFEHLRKWCEGHHLTHHTQEAESEIHDIQEALQEFYHALPKEIPDDELKQEFMKQKLIDSKNQLLEERYFFSNFFSHLKVLEQDGRLIRSEFYFVDNYLEAIEFKIRDLNKVNT